jgi:tRNA uridine 5-carbamoylmethylation protein Kti12
MVIFINGSINSGKTTVAKLLKDRIPNLAHIEVDDLRAFIDWMPLEESIPINLDNTVLLINSFSKRNISSVVTYPLSEDEFEYMTEKIKSKETVHFFTLNPDLETALSNRGRELTDWEKQRIKHHYDIKINNPGFGIVIDNTDQTPEKTVEEMLNYISLNFQEN